MFINKKRFGLADYSIFASASEDGIITTDYIRQNNGVFYNNKNTDELQNMGLYKFNGYDDFKKKVSEHFCHGNYQVEFRESFNSDFTSRRYVGQVYVLDDDLP